MTYTIGLMIQLWQYCSLSTCKKCNNHSNWEHYVSLDSPQHKDNSCYYCTPQAINLLCQIQKTKKNKKKTPCCNQNWASHTFKGWIMILCSRTQEVSNKRWIHTSIIIMKSPHVKHQVTYTCWTMLHKIFKAFPQVKNMPKLTKEFTWELTKCSINLHANEWADPAVSVKSSERNGQIMGSKSLFETKIWIKFEIPESY